ncbi:MAG: hypothetical protein IPI08_14280 [Betaproteobacteria bacterium]|nr:hypothetical protein [Betaproteobacteria bacterium]
MFKKILIANRGDKHCEAVLAAQPECLARAAAISPRGTDHVQKDPDRQSR